MSWSVSIVGTPAKINEKLEAYGDTLEGASKQEFDDARPHLQALIAQNVASAGNPPLMVKLDASGHATFADGARKYGNCSVQIATFYTTLAV